MKYLLDTNILLLYVRKHFLATHIELEYNPFAETNEAFISVVNLAELFTIGVINSWSIEKFDFVQSFVRQLTIIPINNQELVNRCILIDSYSQGKSNEPVSFSARNMGKNDVWIAATTSLLNATLLTTDKDFDHLQNKYLQVVRIVL